MLPMECDGLTYWKFGVKTFGGRRTGGGSGRFRLRLDNGFMSRARVFRTTRVATHPSAERAARTRNAANRATRGCLPLNFDPDQMRLSI